MRDERDGKRRDQARWLSTYGGDLRCWALLLSAVLARPRPPPTTPSGEQPAADEAAAAEQRAAAELAWASTATESVIPHTRGGARSDARGRAGVVVGAEDTVRSWCSFCFHM